MPQLSCEQCRDRKTKCDKQSPCSSCKSAGLQCRVVLRARLPRGRSGKARDKRHALESRVDRLETLLQQATNAKQNDYQSSQQIRSSVINEHERASNSQSFSGMVAPTFWEALSEEVAGIRKTLQASDDEDETPSLRSSPQSDSEYRNWEAEDTVTSSVIFPSPALRDESIDRVTHSNVGRDMLLNTYGSRVDTVFKPLHWPSTRAAILSLEEAATDVSNEPLHALASAIYYMSLCSLSANECRSSFGRPKSELVAQYRMRTESMISAARVLCEPDVIGLQALVVYLQALRTCRGHALNWTILAVAVRLATVLGLEKTTFAGTSPLDVEVRRRLWYSICLMDTQATLDRGSVPLVDAQQLGPPPRECDDADIGGFQTRSSRNSGFTDMTFTSMTFKAMTCFKQINAIPNDEEKGWPNWEKKLYLLNALEQDFQQNYISISDSSATPIQMLTSLSARAILADIYLLLRRPAYRQSSASAAPPWDDFDPLLAATRALEGHINMDVSRVSIWAWKEWTPWYAAAVALAELCKTPVGEISERAYSSVITMYRRYAPQSYDHDQGPLWKPIKKLLRRVEDLRERHRAQPSILQTIEPQATTARDHQSWTAEAPVVERKRDTVELSSEPMVLPHDNFDGLLVPMSSGVDNTYTYIDLRPEIGVSWLDWDLLLPDADVGFNTIGLDS